MKIKLNDGAAVFSVGSSTMEARLVILMRDEETGKLLPRIRLLERGLQGQIEPLRASDLVDYVLFRCVAVRSGPFQTRA